MNLLSHSHKPLSPDFTIRPFLEQDHTIVKQFWLELDQHVLTRIADSARFVKNEQYPEFIDRWLAQYQHNRNTLLLVGECEGRIAGFMVVHKQSQQWYRTDSTGLIAVCFVHVLYRRRGLATRMVNYARDWLLDEKVAYLDVVWDEGNTEAEKFWLAQGFKPAQTRAHQPLEKEPKRTDIKSK